MARRRAGKKIDFVHWTGFLESTLALGAGTVGSLVGVAQHLPETLLRTRGNLLAYVDGLAAGGELVVIGVGMIVVPEGTGSTVLWSPISDQDAPWFWLDQFHLGYEEPVVNVVDVPGASSYRSVIDSKAMRRIPQSSEIQIVYENVTIGAAAAVNVTAVGRWLAGS